jgi:hypothetical protein
VLAEHLIRYAELPDVVQQPGAREQSQLRRGHGHLPADVYAQSGHAQVVGPRLAILDLQSKDHHRIEPPLDLLLYWRKYWH